MKNKKNLLIMKFVGHSGTDTIKVVKNKIVKHPMYKKYIKRTYKYLVHYHKDDNLTIGQDIYVFNTRPISKRKSLAYYGKVKLGDKL